MGENVSVDEYRTRFPDQRDAIEHLFVPRQPALPRPERYHKRSLHGAGGLGQVWLARDVALHRDVALKTIKPELTQAAEVRRRFVREALVTGKLQHPNIVPIHDLELNARDGEPFYTMRLIQGDSLRDRIHKLHASETLDAQGLRALLGALLGVCQAVKYAHSKNVIHRDLKPDNVVLGEYGEIVLLDWGLAKEVDKGDGESQTAGMAVGESEAAPGSSGVAAAGEASANGCDDEGLTAAGGFLGTPAYSAPEQILDAQSAGKLADVYGLGAILFEVLTGRPPHVGEARADLLGRADKEAPRAIQVRRGVPRSLSAVAAKAMAASPDDRYQSVDALIQDVQAWLDDEPVTAHRDSFGESAMRWVRRHRRWAVAMSIAVTMVALVSSAAVFAVNQARQTAIRRADELSARLYTTNLRLADKFAAEGNLEQAHERLMRCPPLLRNWEWGVCLKRANQVSVFFEVAMRKQSRYLNFVSFLDDGSVAVGVRGEKTQVGVMAPGATRFEWSPRPEVLIPMGASRLAWAPNRDALVEMETGKLVLQCRDGDRIVGFAPEMQRFALWDQKGFTFWVLQDNAQRRTELRDAAGESLPIGAGVDVSTKYVAASVKGRLLVWSDVESQPVEIKDLPAEGLGRIRFAPDGVHLACFYPHRILFVDVRTGEQTRTIDYADARSASSIFSPDGRYLALASTKETVIIELSSGQLMSRLKNAAPESYHLQFSRDGSRLAMRNAFQALVWDWKERLPRQRVVAHSISCEDFVAGEDRLLSFGLDEPAGPEPGPSVKTLVSIDCRTGDRRVLASSDEFRGSGRLAANEGATIVAVSNYDQVEIWDAVSARRIGVLQLGDWTSYYRKGDGPRGAVLRIAGDDKLAAAATTDEQRTWQAGASPPSPRDELNHITLWEIGTGKLQFTLEGHENYVTDLRFSTDKTRLMSASLDQTVRMWDTDTGAPGRVYRGHQSAVYALALGPGVVVASGDETGVIKIWNPDSGEELQTLTGHGASVVALTFDLDGSRLVSAGNDESIRVWDWRRGEELIHIETPEHLAATLKFDARGDLYGRGVRGGIGKWDFQSDVPWPHVARRKRMYGYTAFRLPPPAFTAEGELAPPEFPLLQPQPQPQEKPAD